jgi:nicotinamidase-related amidase
MSLKNTAILIIDPYNDFLHPKGKLNHLLKESLAEKNSIANLKILVTTARKYKIPIYYGLHQQHKAGFIAGWKHATPMQQSQSQTLAFEEGSWGVEIYAGLEPSLENGDVIVSKHWSSRFVLAFWKF